MMRRQETTAIPRTQEEIRAWLDGLLSKQYDTEETAVHAVEEYRDLIVSALKAAADDAWNGGKVQEPYTYGVALREFAASLGGMGR